MKGEPITPEILEHMIGCGRLYDTIVYADLKKFNMNINIVEHSTILCMATLGGDCSFEELIQASQRDKSTISKHLKKFTYMGLVECYKDGANKKNKYVRLTDTGKEYYRNSLARFREWNDRMTVGFSEEEKNEVNMLLRKYYSNTLEGIIDIHDDEKLDVPKLSNYIIYITKWIHRKDFLVIRDTEFDVQQIQIMMYLLAMGGEGTYKRIEKGARVSQSCVVKQARALEERGLVFNYIDDSDSRVKHSELTEAGHEKAAYFRNGLLELDEFCLNGFTDEEKLKLKEYAKRFWFNTRAFKVDLVGE